MNETYYSLATIQERIDYLKNNGIPLPDIATFNSQWDEKQHRIMTRGGSTHNSAFILRGREWKER